MNHETKMQISSSSFTEEVKWAGKGARATPIGTHKSRIAISKMSTVKSCNRANRRRGLDQWQSIRATFRWLKSKQRFLERRIHCDWISFALEETAANRMVKEGWSKATKNFVEMGGHD
jgi:hypothetical protein